VSEHRAGDQTEDFAHAVDLARRIGERLSRLNELHALANQDAEGVRPTSVSSDDVARVSPSEAASIADEIAALAAELATVYRDIKVLRQGT
jgi:HAMP domain-containing protein